MAIPCNSWSCLSGLGLRQDKTVAKPTVNFAMRAKCAGAAVTVGFIDTTCPPTSVYAAYNARTMSESLHPDPLAGHTVTPGASKFMHAAALEHLK